MRPTKEWLQEARRRIDQFYVFDSTDIKILLAEIDALTSEIKELRYDCDISYAEGYKAGKQDERLVNEEDERKAFEAGYLKAIKQWGWCPNDDDLEARQAWNDYKKAQEGE